MEGRIESKEGCLSIPGFYEYVYRYEKIQIDALDLDGNEVVYYLMDFSQLSFNMRMII